MTSAGSRAAAGPHEGVPGGGPRDAAGRAARSPGPGRRARPARAGGRRGDRGAHRQAPRPRRHGAQQGRSRGAGPRHVRPAARQSRHGGLLGAGGGRLMRRVAVVVFPGSNCDADTLHAARAAGCEAYVVWHRERDLGQADVVILAGGFSYGDYLRSGAIARFSPVMAAVAEHAPAGGQLLGICHGFQILCEAGLLPGALMRNAGLRFLSRPVSVRVEATDTPFTCLYEPGEVLELPIAHRDGRYAADPQTTAELEARGQVVWRYRSEEHTSELQSQSNLVCRL